MVKYKPSMETGGKDAKRKNLINYYYWLFFIVQYIFHFY